MVRDKDGIDALRRFFVKKDIDHMSVHRKPYHYTSGGVFSPTEISSAKQIFDRIRLGSFRSFVDLGSGDGRVVFLASSYTKAFGIENDPSLLADSKESSRLLGIDSEFLGGDYLTHDLSGYDVIYIAPDTPFHNGLEKKLREEMTGMLVVNSPLFLPRFLDKVETFVVDGMPITVYKNA